MWLLNVTAIAVGCLVILLAVLWAIAEGQRERRFRARDSTRRLTELGER